MVFLREWVREGDCKRVRELEYEKLLSVFLCVFLI